MPKPQLNVDGMTMQERAELIALIVRKTPVEDRHVLFEQVAETLQLYTQGFQAQHFRIARNRELGIAR